MGLAGRLFYFLLETLIEGPDNHNHVMKNNAGLIRHNRKKTKNMEQKIWCKKYGAIKNSSGQVKHNRATQNSAGSMGYKRAIVNSEETV